MNPVTFYQHVYPFCSENGINGEKKFIYILKLIFIF